MWKVFTMYSSSFFIRRKFLSDISNSLCALANKSSKCVLDSFTFFAFGASNGTAFLSKLSTIARSYTLSDILNVLSSLFAVPTNHMFVGSRSLPLCCNSLGSSSHLSATTSKFRPSGLGISSSDKNSAK